jgi:hypothetical protein
MATERPKVPGQIRPTESSNRSAPTPIDNRTPARPRGAARSLNLEAPHDAQKRDRNHAEYHAAVLRHFRHSAGRFYGAGFSLTKRMDCRGAGVKMATCFC